MRKINPYFVYNEQKTKTGVILSFKDFERCIDSLEDYHDHTIIVERSKERGPTIPFEEVVKSLKKKTTKALA